MSSKREMRTIGIWYVPLNALSLLFTLSLSDSHTLSLSNTHTHTQTLSILTVSHTKAHLSLAPYMQCDQTSD